ncbi:Os02g0527650 [Oryza sativa Japonica Group]|uniref:Os02g0527650 protein n=1 Tax=Oryza sativa subsp. japonica TaxID=39947 RepID=A0A0N7KFE6_ORYSJ|nr:Os02g0527650 [Oryza sativa Japonica Group]
MPGRRRKAAESSARRRRSSGRGGGWAAASGKQVASGVGQVGGQRCWSSGGDDGSARLAGGLGARRGREEEKTRLWERTNGRQGPYVSEVETGAFWAIRNYNGLHVGPRIYRV